MLIAQWFTEICAESLREDGVRDYGADEFATMGSVALVKDEAHAKRLVEADALQEWREYNVDGVDEEDRPDPPVFVWQLDPKNENKWYLLDERDDAPMAALCLDSAELAHDPADGAELPADPEARAEEVDRLAREEVNR